MKLGKDFKIGFVLVSVCYLALGLALLFYPAFSTTMLCYILGAITVVYGLAHVVSYFARTEFEDVYRLDLTWGVVLTALGVFVVARPETVMAVLNVVIGCAILLDSLIKLQNAIDLKRLGSRIWWTVLVLALLTGALGLTLLLRDTYAMFTFTQFIGLCLVVDGCVNVWSILFLSINLRKLRKARKEAMEQAAENASAVDVQAHDVPEMAPAESAPVSSYENAPAPSLTLDDAPAAEPSPVDDSTVEIAPPAVVEGAPDAPAAPEKKFSLRGLFGFNDSPAVSEHSETPEPDAAPSASDDDAPEAPAAAEQPDEDKPV